MQVLADLRTLALVALSCPFGLGRDFQAVSVHQLAGDWWLFAIHNLAKLEYRLQYLGYQVFGALW